jgi:DNA-binding NarL/FixJ family response regulator
MRILLLEDEPRWQQRIRDIADANDQCEIVAICANLADGLRAIRSVEFDVLIVDLGLPDGSGNEAIRAARRHAPNADILVATVFDDEHSVVSAIYAGATGYIVKDSSAAEWISAMTDLRAGHSPISPKVARHILRRVQQPTRHRRQDAARDDNPPSSAPEAAALLSSREMEVLRLVAKGFSLVEVAQILHVAHTTTRTHAKNIYGKLEVNSRGEAVFEATRMGLL